MTLDKSSNFAKTTITGIASGATEVVLDDATNFLDPASGEYNCVIWEISNYGNPTDDPNKEIVRATALSGSTLTITRAQESTLDSNHNTGGETYAIANVLTKKMIDDIETEIDAKANLISPSFTTPNIGAATGTSLALEGTTLGILNLKNTDAASYSRMLFDGTGTDFTQGVGNASAAIADLQNKFYIYDFTNSKTAFTIVPDTLAAKFYGSLEAINLSGTNTGDEVAASSAEINAGTDETKYVTPDALAGSDYEKNPMTTAGDIIYGGTNGAPTRLEKGTDGQVLTMNAGATAPEWADASGGGSDDQLLTAVVTVSSADLKALNTSPKTLLSAPGPNKIIILEGVVVYSTGGSISYTGGSTATIYYDNETTTAISNTIGGSYLAADASTTKILHVPGISSSNSMDGMQNRGIVLKTTADFADGDGTSKLYIRYRICSA